MKIRFAKHIFHVLQDWLPELRVLRFFVEITYLLCANPLAERAVISRPDGNKIVRRSKYKRILRDAKRECAGERVRSTTCFSNPKYILYKCSSVRYHLLEFTKSSFHYLAYATSRSQTSCCSRCNVTWQIKVLYRMSQFYSLIAAVPVLQNCSAFDLG